MYRILLLIIPCLLLALVTKSQIKAVTEDGKVVILYKNGTWTAEDSNSFEGTKLILSNINYTKDSRSNFLLKSKKTSSGFWINTQKWTINPQSNDETTEYHLTLKEDDVFAMILTEKFEVPLDALRDIALKNAKEAAPDITIIQEEYRMVNNKKVLMLKLTGSIQGINFTYFGYYYSNKTGTVQFVTYTAQNLFNEVEDVCESLLNGLVDLTVK